MMQRVSLFALAVGVFALPAYASDYSLSEAIASVVVHEKRCNLKVDKEALTKLVKTGFDDPAYGVNGLRTDISIFQRREAKMSGLELDVRCAGIRAFAEAKGIVVTE